MHSFVEVLFSVSVITFCILCAKYLFLLQSFYFVTTVCTFRRMIISPVSAWLKPLITAMREIYIVQFETHYTEPGHVESATVNRNVTQIKQFIF